MPEQMPVLYDINSYAIKGSNHNFDIKIIK